MKNLLGNFQNGKFQTALVLIIAQILVTLVPGLSQYNEGLREIAIAVLALVGFDALQKGLSIRYGVSNDLEETRSLVKNEIEVLRSSIVEEVEYNLNRTKTRSKEGITIRRKE